ncbi:unnamed protein product [Clonostachys rosea f. rosea IK726]|uniref:Uncharacterized protein n=1 Tax=Clonostachys rosea f. rosea IK726 TaxID=1349383 RepID=A0ACA9U0C0_BIOOC|nr:unnamed protein product [Clonostachys rosea f. rosea IK726]
MSAFEGTRQSSPPSPTQHRQQYQPPAQQQQQQQQQPVYRPSYPQQQYPPPHQYQRPQYPPQQQQGQQYQPPYLQQQYQPPPPQQYPPQQYPAQHPQSQQEEYAHHQQQHHESSPPQSPQEELSSPVEQVKRTGSFKGLPPIRRGSTFGISLREATSAGMIDDSDIPPVPSLSPSADIPDHALLGSDVAAPLENGTNISIGQNSEVTLVGADSSRTRRTSLGLKDSNRDSQHNSHRSSSASHSLQIDTVAANAGNEIPEVPQVPPQFGQQQPQFVAPPPQFAAPPSGWAMQTSNLQAPLVPVARKRAGTNSNTSPQQPANFGLEKETGAEQNDPGQTFGNPSGFAKDTGMSAATPVSPIQSTYRPSGHPPLQSPTRATRPSNPPSAAARHPDLFPNVPQSPTTRGRAGSTGQTSTHSDQQVSRFSMDSNDRQQDRPPQSWAGAIKNNSPKMDDEGRSRMSLLKNISNRINQLPQRDSRGLVPDHHRPHSTEPHMHDDDDDDSEISLENPPQPRRKRTSVLTGTAVGNRSSMDEMRFPRPGSPTNSHKAPSTHSEKKKSLFGKITQSGRFKSGLAKSTTLGSVNESTATSSVNSNGSTLKSKYFAGGFSGLAGKLKRQGKENSQQPSRPFHGQPMTVIGSNDHLPSEPSSPNGGGFYPRPRTGSTAAASVPQPPPSIPEHEQESRPRRGSMSGVFSSLRGKASAQLKPDENGANGRAETPPLSAALRPPPLFAPSNSHTGPMDPDTDGMYQNGPRMGGRPMSQGQQQVRPSPLAQAQSQSRLDLETSSVESDEEDHLVGHRASTSPSLTTARTSGPSQRGSGPTGPKQDHSEPSDYAPRPIGSAGETQDLNYPGYKGPFATNGIPPNEGAYGSARRQPTPHSGALPAFLASDAKPAVGLRRPSDDRANQGILARKPVPNPVPIPGPASATVTAPRPATPDSLSEPPVSAAGPSGWGSSTDVPLPEDKTLQQVKPLPGAPGSSPPQGIVSEPSIHSIGPASRRYPSPQPSAMSVISSMQNQGDGTGRDSISAARADPQKSGWKALRERVSSGLSHPKAEKEKSSGGGKLFSVLKRGSKAPGPIKGIEEENMGQQNGPLPSPLGQQLPGSGHRPMYTVVARPGQIPAGAVPVNQQGQGPPPSHWDNPQALGALGRGQPVNGDGRPQQPSRMQQMLTKAPEPQYGSVPIPKGYTAVHGEGGIVPTSYRVGPQPHGYPQGQQQHPGQPYPYGAPQQAYYGQSPQGQMPHSPLPPGSQQGPQPDSQHAPYTMVRNGSVAESHAPSIVSVPPGAQASHEALNPEDDRNPDALRGARPPQIVQQIVQHPDRSHEINVAGVLPTPASQDEFVLPIQGAGSTQNGSQLSQPTGPTQINGSSANGNRPNILRGNSIASEGARSNESGVMGIYSPKDRSVDRELHKPNALHLKVSNHNLTSSEVSRENSSASSEGHGQERVAQRMEVIKVVSPTNSISNDTIKGGPGSINGSSRARSIDVSNPSTRSRAGSKLAAESSQDTKRVTAQDSNDDLYDATPKIKQGNGKPATTGPETPSKPKVPAKSPAERKPKAASPAPLAKAGPSMAQPKAASPVPQAKTGPPLAQPKPVSPAAQVKAVSAIQAKPASPVAQAKAASPVAQAKAASPVAQAKAASPATQAKAASPIAQAKAAASSASQAKAASPVTQTKAAPPATQPKSSSLESGEASRGFTVELADTADARMRTLRLNEQEEKIFYEPEGEPPKMTATSYPGQEWNPYGEPEFWNDE